MEISNAVQSVIMSTSIVAVKKACEIAGSQAALALKLGISMSMVSQWCTGARPVPTDRAIDIEREVGVPVEEIRPDVDWAVIRGKPPTHGGPTTAESKPVVIIHAPEVVALTGSLDRRVE